MSKERAFRRLVHTFSTAFVGYYLIPVGSRLPLKVLAVALFAFALGFDAARLAGWLPWQDVYGLRGYEQERPASYVYFGAGALPLILFAPEQVTIVCLLLAGIGDPVMGEVRLHVGPWTAVVVGVAVGTAFGVIVGLPAGVALAAGATFAAAEALKNPWLDDDLLNQAVPALVLLGLAALGVWLPVDVIQPLMLEAL